MLTKSTTYLQFFAGIILLIAFLAQSIIPSGFMPSFQIGKTFHITICQGADQVNIEVDGDMNPVQKSGHSTDTKSPCLYSSVLGKYMSVADFVFAQTIHLSYEEFVVRDMQSHDIYQHYPAYFPQAPPSFLG
jgi:hypothetical protein